MDKAEITIKKGSPEYKKLLGWVADLPPGFLIENKKAAEVAGVSFDRSLQGKIRRALLRCDKEYEAIDNVGYLLADVKRVEPILYGKLRQVDKRIKRATKAQRVLFEAFQDKVPKEVKGRLVVTGVFLATIQYFDEKSRKNIAEGKALQPLKLMEPKPILPDELVK